MILTKEEKAIILSRRNEQRKIEEIQSKRLQILQISFDYEKWLIENGRFSSFTTFVDEFGYDEKDNAIIFKQVESIRHHAYEMILGRFKQC